MEKEWEHQGSCISILQDSEKRGKIMKGQTASTKEGVINSTGRRTQGMEVYSHPLPSIPNPPSEI